MNAAAPTVGLVRVDQITVHPHKDDEWLIASVQENVIRAKITDEERLRTVRALLDLGCSRDGIAEAFGVTTSTIGSWLRPHPPKSTRPDGWKDGRLSGPKVRALVADWRERELDRDAIIAELEALFPPNGTAHQRRQVAA